MSHWESCLIGSLDHTWSSVFSPTPFISQCVCVCAYVRGCVRGCRNEGVMSHMEFCLLPHTVHLAPTYRMKESCHIGRHVTYIIVYINVMANGVVSHTESCHRGSHVTYSIVYIKESWQIESCHIWRHVTEGVMARTVLYQGVMANGVMSHMQQCHRGSHVMYIIVDIKESWQMESCHIWRHVTYDIMSQRESCHVQCIYQGVMSRTESCQRWSHVTEGVMSRTVSISISHVTYRVMSDMESCHVGSHVRGLIGVSIGRGEVKFVLLKLAF